MKRSDILFADIYIDDVNLYIDGRRKILIFDMPLINQIKEHLTAQQGYDLDKWLLVKYQLPTIIECMEAWQAELKEKQNISVYSRFLRIRWDLDGVNIYKLIGKNQLKYLTHTKDVDWVRKTKDYLSWVARDKWFLQSVVLVKKELQEVIFNGCIPIVEKIYVISNNLDDYCLSYFDLDNLPSTPTPAWDNFVRQFTFPIYAELFRAWIYSIYVGKNYGRQLLWINGKGKSGKTTIINTIGEHLSLVNDSIVKVMPKFLNTDKYTLSQFTDIRLTTIGDCIDSALIKREEIKNLTGNDEVVIRNMFQSERRAKVYSKILVSSNRRPFISTSLDHELTRIIFVSLDDEKCYEAENYWDVHTMGQWKHKLKEELPAFIHSCKPYYEKHLSPDGENLIIYKEMVQDLELYAQFHTKREIDLWWKNCIKKDEQGKLTFEQLVEDYFRFLTRKNTKISIIRSFIMTKLREEQIIIHNLNIANSLAIKGYKFINPDITVETLKMDAVNEL
jgi:hypothetical protein